MSRQALESYSNNSPNVSRYGGMKIKATASDIVMRVDDKNFAGAFIY